MRNVWGVGKVYDTYVGAKLFEPNNTIFSEIRKVGEEYGATTGRPRQCNWLDLDQLKKSIRVNGVTHLVLNKVDVLEQLDKFVVYCDGTELKFRTLENMKKFINSDLVEYKNSNNTISEVYFSGNKENIGVQQVAW